MDYSLQRRTRIYVTIVCAAAIIAVALVWWFSPAASQDEVEAAVFFSLAALVAHGLAYRLPGGGFGDITFIPLLSAVAVAPGFPTILGTAAAVLCAEYLRRREPIRILFNAAQFTVAVALAIAVYLQVDGRPMTSSGSSYWLPFVGAFGAFFVTNALLFAGVVAVSTRQHFSAVLLRALGGSSLIYDMIGVPIVLGFAYAYVRIGWAWSGGLLLPLFAVRLVYKANRELQTVNEELLQLMVAAIEARDPYTSGHSQRVATYSRVVSRAAGLGAAGAERVYKASLLHDVGKIHEEFAPILRKAGRLSPDEFAIMRTHSAKGAELVARVTQFEDLVSAVRGHHEAWDGSGYPDGLARDSIPRWARIIAIADTVDAMTSDRPYRAALTPAEVKAEIIRGSGTQFDPQIATALVSDAHWRNLEIELLRVRSGSATDPDHAPMLRHSAAHTAALV